MIRMIAARWFGQPPAAGRVFSCRPASVGVLGFEHDSREQPILCLWNYISAPRELSKVSAAHPTERGAFPGKCAHD
jgi:probable phosphoglycerate mutase